MNTIPWTAQSTHTRYRSPISVTSYTNHKKIKYIKCNYSRNIEVRIQYIVQSYNTETYENHRKYRKRTYHTVKILQE